MTFSFRGWKWRLWLQGEVGNIKTVLGVLCGILTAVLTSHVASPELAGAIGTIMAIVSRGLLSLVDFAVQDSPTSPDA